MDVKVRKAKKAELAAAYAAALPKQQALVRKNPRELTPKAQSLEIKTMVLGALQKAGGEAWLVQQAHKNPLGFMALLGKVMAIQAGRVNPEGQQINVNVSWLTGDRLAYQRQAPVAPRVDVADSTTDSGDLW